MKKWFMMIVGGLALMAGSVTSSLAALSNDDFSKFVDELTKNSLTDPKRIADDFKKLSPDQINGVFDRISKIDNKDLRMTISNNLLDGYILALQDNQLTKEQIVATFNQIYTEKEKLTKICLAHIPNAGDSDARRKALAESSARLVASVSPALPKDSRDEVLAEILNCQSKEQLGLVESAVAVLTAAGIIIINNNQQSTSGTPAQPDVPIAPPDVPIAPPDVPIAPPDLPVISPTT